jgi:hypothetical protein
MPTEPIYVGATLAELIEDVPATVEIDEIGIARATLNYTTLWESAPQLVLDLAVHPDFPWLLRKNSRITRDGGKTANVEVNFEGVSATFEEQEANKIYGIEGSTSTSPIETHRSFPIFAGRLGAENFDTGAQFYDKGESRGMFRGFRAVIPKHLPEGIPGPPEEVPNPKAGMKSFLDGGLILTETASYSRLTEETITQDMTNLGKIDVPPDNDVMPTVESPRNWLLITCSIIEIGEGVKVVKKWRLSGRLGWDADIYGPDA